MGKRLLSGRVGNDDLHPRQRFAAGRQQFRFPFGIMILGWQQCDTATVLGHAVDLDEIALQCPHRFAQQAVGNRGCPVNQGTDRSEEHTSELKSLMSISYAVLCLKKKTRHSEKEHYNNYKTQ